MTHPQPPAHSHSQRIRQLAKTRQRVLAMPAEKAMEAIFTHPQPAALIHSFPEEELHFLIHDIGPAEALPLISLASNRQWEYLLDMEAWNRDQVDFPLATTWLDLLMQADPERLIKWCFEEQLEFLEFYLFRNIELRILETDQPPSDLGEGYFTDDDAFYVRLVDYPVATPEEEAIKARRNAVLSQLLRRLSVFDHPRYQGLLMEAVSVIPGETEEELFRLRNVRLAEKGFLPFDEAVGVYQPLRPGDLANRGRKIIRTPSPGDIRIPVPQFTAAFLEEDDLFLRSLKGIGDAHVMDQLQVELASLCNRVISADREIIRSRDQLRTVVFKVSGYLSIGLELSTAGVNANRAAAAATILQRHLLEDIFRTGYAGALDLHWRADRWRKTSWFQSQQMELTFWDEAWMGLLGGLMLDRPKYYDPDLPAAHYRDFLTHAEVEEIGRGLDRLIAVDQLFKEMDVTLKRLDRDRFLTYKNLLLTLWTRARLELPAIDGASTTMAIPLPAFKPFYTSLWSDLDGRRCISDAEKQNFLLWAAETSGQPAETLSDRLGTVFEALFDEIESELGSVRTGDLDVRHVNLFLLKP
jgi:hypothetical protein